MFMLLTKSAKDSRLTHRLYSLRDRHRKCNQSLLWNPFEEKDRSDESPKLARESRALPQADHAGTLRNLPSFQMIMGKPRRRISARFLRVARLWACEGTHTSGDISFSAIGFSPLYRFLFMEREEFSQLNNTLSGGRLLKQRENPVRAGLVDYAANWPYQGEIVVIDRA
jgi:hypothetical protein